HQLHQAHAAIGGDAQARVPAVMRHVDARALGGPDDRVTGLERNLFIVQFEARHLGLDRLASGGDARRFRVWASFWLRSGAHVLKYAPVRRSPKPRPNAELGARAS